MSYDQHQHLQSHPHQQQHPQNMAPSYHHYPPAPSHHGPPQHLPHAQQQHQYPPPQQHHQQQYQHPGHPSAHPQNSLPPMPQYSTHQMPPQMQPQLPSQMPPPEMPGGAPPHQAQLVPEPTRSIEPVSRKDEGGRTYKLDVVQQPKRARMCGFGDKDRRPITPPPCVLSGQCGHSITADDNPAQYPLSNGYGPAPPYGYSNGGIPEYGRTEYGQNQFQARNSIGGAGAPQGMYTRNLIGSLAASAFRLSDVAEHIGIWFILQDLSVRTEGSFRLRFSFVNVGPPTRAPSTNPSNPGAVTRSGKAPILACCYSEPFTVFSAKKFPGVCESTSLSKCFASQGIKIPIRKEGQDNKRGKDDDDDDY
ncbi:VelB [Verticillium alfalfae VaMs.102]|uniref:VelB n=1 Tax=Verticillium alfalfae (strain VaMs.102 / ATCC MYA-4576 / FGSC 10136) TaxID=526221 RepID=C9SHG0_VERA1|nr:VelB [Verticillium alfalfae VaMs.102]EEY18383.1 VelB [Verticillium alfalfae VaMs.102]